MATAEDHTVSAKLGKRKRSITEQINGRAKFEEYLDVMQPPSKSKTWSNEDLAKQAEVAHSTLRSPQLNSIGNDDNGKYETVHQKSKGAPQPHQDKELLCSSENDPTTATIITPRSDVISEAPLLHEQELPLTTDGDWLRSRTSNLVELNRTDDDVEALEASRGTDILLQDSINADEPPQSIVLDLSMQSIQGESVPGNQIPTSAVSASYATGRIFVRNLAYGSTEDDLREYFTSQGSDSVQDVRSTPSSIYFVCFCLFYDEDPDRDNLCLTYDVTRRSTLVDTAFSETWPQL